jgi:hypothetical protein
MSSFESALSVHRRKLGAAGLILPDTLRNYPADELKDTSRKRLQKTFLDNLN